MGLIEFGDVGSACPMKRRRRQDEDRGIDGQSETKREGGIDGSKFDRLTLLVRFLAITAGLHQARMQVKIMRHHGGAENAERQIQHLAVSENVRGRRET